MRWLSTINYDTLEKLPRVKTPVLVMHSRNDTLIRFHHAERNFAAANEPKLFWETNGDHNYTLSSDHERCWEGLEKFFEMLGETPGRAEAIAVAPPRSRRAASVARSSSA